MQALLMRAYLDSPSGFPQKKGVLFSGLIVLLVMATHAYAETLPANEFPSLMSSLAALDPAPQFCGEPVPIEKPEVLERFEKELLLSLWNRAQVILWLKRSARYLEPIADMLQESGVPEDIKYLAVVESALRPHVRSGKGAVGFWQFMAATGRKYGLTINKHIDQRRNFLASTRAAILYLKDLHEMFGSWTLAAAAYNMGEAGLMAAINVQKIDDYYTLYIPLETQRFIFKILSVKLILSEPSNFGFHFSEKDGYAPFSVDPVQIDMQKEIPLQLIAEAAQTHFKQIKDLNPEIRGHFLVAGEHTLMVPKGRADGFNERLSALVSAYRTDQTRRIYTVKAGDNLSLIADRFGVSLISLIIWNRLDITKPIHPGDRILVYPQMKTIIKEAQP